MDKKSKIKTIVAMALNAFIFFFTIGPSAWMFFQSGEGNMEVSGFNIFKYFTMDSNILCGIACIIYFFFQIRLLKNGKEIPHWAVILKSSMTSAIALTFLTVVCFLGPTQGFWIMFQGNNLFLHGLCPVAAMVSFVVFEKESLSWKCGFFSIAPTFVYSLFYILFVAILKTWKDFYGFTFGGHFEFVPLVLFVMYAASFGIGVGLIALKKLCNRD